MALFKLSRGDSSRLNDVKFTDGYAYLCTDDESFYIDAVDSDGNEKRILINKQIAKTIIESNADTEISIWIGTKEEYNALSEQEKTNCLCITTDDLEEISFESVSNKVTVIDENSNNITYPTTLAVKNYMSNIDGYEKTDNKDTVISNASDDNHYPTSKAVYENVNNTVNSAKETILQTVEERVYGVEKQSNKVTEITEDAKHTTYPSSLAVLQAIEAFGGTDIETTNTIDENSTADEVPNAKATYDFVQNEMANINSIIQSQTSTVYSGTSEPDASIGKAGDLWVVIE